MDQEKPAHQELSWNFTQCCDDSILDCSVRVPGAGIPEISVEGRTLNAADVANIAAKVVRKTRFQRAVLTTKAKNIVIQQAVIAYPKL